jgi:2-deoxy-D-gluconate 3-dehydrogenase
VTILEKFKLDGKIALVTGCSKGIGFGIAKGLAEAGADIIGVSSSLRKGSEIEKYVESIGRSFHCISCDFSERQNTHSFLKELDKNSLEPNILVSNAGSLIRTELNQHSDDHWDRILEINLSSQFVLARELSSRMIERGWGKIIFTASILSHQGGLFVPSYSASKGGIAQLTKALSNELADRGINVNSIAPGYVVTDITTALRQDKTRSADLMARIPMKRWGTIDDMAGAAVYLASDASEYVNGELLNVDGGWMGR